VIEDLCTCLEAWIICITKKFVLWGSLLIYIDAVHSRTSGIIKIGVHFFQIVLLSLSRTVRAISFGVATSVAKRTVETFARLASCLGVKDVHS
jgi:hypothetical protein